MSWYSWVQLICFDYSGTSARCPQFRRVLPFTLIRTIIGNKDKCKRFHHIFVTIHRLIRIPSNCREPITIDV
jgi:hypothetical protein